MVGGRGDAKAKEKASTKAEKSELGSPGQQSSLKRSGHPSVAPKAPASPLPGATALGTLAFNSLRESQPDTLSPVPLYCSSQAGCLQNYVCSPTSFVNTSSSSQNKHSAIWLHTNLRTRKKERERKWKPHGAHVAQEHKSSVSGRRDNSSALHPCFSLPPSPPSSSFPIPHQETQRASSAWDPCQRVKDTSCSKRTALPALLQHSRLFLWGWAAGRLGSWAQGQPHWFVCVPGLEALQWGWRSLAHLRFDLFSQWLHWLGFRNCDTLFEKEHTVLGKALHWEGVDLNSGQPPPSPASFSPQAGWG